MSRSAVTLVVNVAAELYPPQSITGIKVKKFGIMDGQKDVPEEWFVEMSQAVENELLVGGKVLLVCAAGASRSVVACATVLLNGCGRKFEPNDVLELIARKRPNTNPHPELIRELGRYFGGAPVKERTPSG